MNCILHYYFYYNNYYYYYTFDTKIDMDQGLELYYPQISR